MFDIKSYCEYSKYSKYIWISNRLQVVSAGGLSSGYGFSSDGSFEMGDDSSSGRVKLPGSSFVQSFKPRGDPLKAHKARKG